MNFKIIREKVKVNFFGKMDKNILDIGLMVKNMAKVSGHLQMAICMMDNGLWERFKVMVYIILLMVSFL